MKKWQSICSCSPPPICSEYPWLDNKHLAVTHMEIQQNLWFRNIVQRTLFIKSGRGLLYYKRGRRGALGSDITLQSDGNHRINHKFGGIVEIYPWIASLKPGFDQIDRQFFKCPSRQKQWNKFWHQHDTFLLIWLLSLCTHETWNTTTTIIPNSISIKFQIPPRPWLLCFSLCKLGY